MYSLKQAADAVGRGKPALLKAMKNGRISAKKNDKGEWEIDPVELHRVYPPVSGTGSGTSSGERQEPPKEPPNIGVLETKIEALQDQLKRERETVNDLRNRLDNESEERRKLTLMLTHDREEKRPSRGRIGRAWAVLTGKL